MINILCLVLFFLTFSFSSQSTIFNEFLNSFTLNLEINNFQTQRKKYSFNITDDNKYNKIKQKLYSFRFKEIFILLSNILTNTQISEFNEIKNKIDSNIKSIEFLEKIVDNLNELITIVLEVKKTELSPVDLGKTISNIFNILFNKKFYPNSRCWPESKTQFDLTLSGILEGISKVPCSENKCYKQINKNLYSVKIELEKIYEMFKNRKYSEAINQFYLTLFEFASKYSSCKFLELAKSLVFYTTPFGIAKIFYYASISREVYEIGRHYIEKKFFESGLGFGKFIRNLLKWKTE